MRINRKHTRFSILALGLLASTLFFASAMNNPTPNARAASDDESNDETYITIYDAGNELVVKSSATTVHEVLERAEIEVEKEDIVEPGLDESINGENFNINIYREIS